jgi:hypothetical protein
MNIEDQLKQLRDKYKTATSTNRQIIIRQARALKIALEIEKSGKNS